jgi:chemotaxis protein methyltransferase CheR
MSEAESTELEQDSRSARAARTASRRDDESCEFIIALIYERSRIRLHDGKHALIKARLGKRMRLLGFPSLSDYCQFLQSPAGTEEVTHAVDALTTNFTNFLREEDHFQFLVNQALPAMLGKTRRKFSLWSAACASGEEPFSLAFYLEEKFPLAEGWDWRILATDISTKALGKAEASVYAGDRLEGLSNAWLRKYFQMGTGQAEGYFRVKNQIRERINFRNVNLLGAYDFPDRFEAILCRNVMIYFDRPTQQQLVTNLSRFLVPSGYLLIGHSESLTGLPVPFRCLRPSYYQKN